MKRLWPAVALLAALSSPGFSQYYPSGGSIYPRGGRQSGAAKGKNDDSLLATFRGPLKGVDKKSILLEMEGDNDLQFHLTKKTTVWDGRKKLSTSDLKLGSLVSVDAKRFPDGSLDAVTVRLERPAKKAEEP